MNAKSQKKRAAATKSISLFKQAIAFHQVGDLKNAALTYQQILINKPENADALNLLGVVYSQLGNYEYGVKLITRAISINPGISAYFNNLANVYRKKGEPEAAVHAYQQALKLDQNNIYAHNGLGVIRYEQNRLDDAILSYRNALEINPKYVESLDNLGLALHKMEAFEEAVENFQRAIQNDPNYAQAHSNLAISLRAIGKPEESIRSFERALEINPDDEYSVINLFRELQAICDWDKIKKLTPGLDKITDKNLARREKTVETPFMSISRKMDPEENLKIARSRSSDISKRALSTSEPFDFRSRTLKNKKIRLGYLSNNFNNHPVAHQIQNLFRLHDRKRFDVFTYSYGKDDGSEYRKNIMLNADKFIDIRGYEDAEAAKQVYNDNIDILIDLVVFTEGGRLNICAMRPSPIQVNYFGFSGTSGADFFDYIIVDRVLVPESHRPFFSEKPVYVPHSFIVTNCSQKISEKIFKRADFSLPENAVVFCSFNNMYKIEPVMFDSWMNMLKKVTGSVLWLLSDNHVSENNLRKEAGKRGIDPARLIFADRLPKDAHLARLRLADLILDTRIYNGHVSGSDALWAGVPVITTEGGHFASRVCSSMLHAIGLPELVAKDLKEYETLAIQLASSPAELENIRKKLARNRPTTPLFNSASFSKNLEIAYEKMWSLCCEGKPPVDIKL